MGKEMIDEETIYDAAVRRWGVAAQMDMALEEMGELVVAIQQRRRNRVTDKNIAEEVADVTIMMRQLRIILGEDLVDALIRGKVGRLKGRLENCGWEFDATPPHHS